MSELDKDLAVRNGDTNDFFTQYNKIDHIKNLIVVYLESKPVGCGAMKEYDNETMHIKN